MAVKQVKCLWCGKTVPLSTKGRPMQHRNGPTTCVGSGQLAEVHERVRSNNPDTLTPQPKKVRR